MKGGFLNRDVFTIIVLHMDWFTLQNFKLVNSFCYKLTEEELKKKIKSQYPFGNKNAKISIIANDMNLDSISVIMDKKEIFIPPDKYALPPIRNFIHVWFVYNFANEKFVLTSNLFKSIIRVINRRLMQNNLNVGEIDENRQVLIFKYIEDGKTILEEVM